MLDTLFCGDCKQSSCLLGGLAAPASNVTATCVPAAAYVGCIEIKLSGTLFEGVSCDSVPVPANRKIPLTSARDRAMTLYPEPGRF